MLVKGETFNERKAFLLDNIKVCREMIRTVNECVIKKNPDGDHNLAYEVIAGNRAIIRQTMAELTSLKKWQKARVTGEKNRLSQKGNS